MEIKVAYFKKYGKLPGPKFDDYVPKNLYDGFKIPSSELLDWLKERGKNLKLTTEWEDMDSEAHDKAFTVAKVITADILQTIFDSVLKAKADGWTVKQFQDNLLPELEEKGWAGATPHRLKVIYDTNMRMAQAKGKYRKQKSIAAIYPYWVYKQIDRKNKRHDHSKWNNKKFRHDDPIWNTIYPPSAFGCGCTVSSTKDGTGVEDGNQYLKEIKNSDDYKISPLKAWEPDTTKYVEVIKQKLSELLGKKPDNKKNWTPDDYNYLIENNEYISNYNNKYENGLKLKEKHRQFPNILKEEYIATIAYTDDGYKDLNYNLRLGLKSDEMNIFKNILNDALDAMDSYIGTVYRATSLNKGQFEKYLNAMKNNEPILEKAFTSTTTDHERINEFMDNEKIELNMEFVIKSKNGKDISKISIYEKEKEVLFKAGTKFKVISINQYTRTIELEEVD